MVLLKKTSKCFTNGGGGYCPPSLVTLVIFNFLMYLHELSHLISHVLSQNSSQKENRRTSIKRLRTEPSLAIKNITNTIPTSITTG
jgi:hypothetical protein